MFTEEYWRYLAISAVVLVVAFIASRVLNWVLNKTFQRAQTDDDSQFDIDQTQLRFVQNSINWIIGILALSIVFNTIPDLRAIGATLFAGAGLVTIVVGFASQQAFSNIVSGIFVIFFKPFRIGDTITIGADTGVVEDITLRHTVLKDSENNRIIIPNNTISSATIKNATIGDANVMNNIILILAPDTNIEKAMQIMEQEGTSHAFSLDMRTEQEKIQAKKIANAKIVDMDAAGVKVRLSVWADNAEKAALMKSDLLQVLKKRFEHEKIVLGGALK